MTDQNGAAGYGSAGESKIYIPKRISAESTSDQACRFRDQKREELRDEGKTKAAARELIHGMPAEEWKATRQTPATQEQIERMEASLRKNGPDLR